MAYGVIMLYHLYMPSYILRTFTEYPNLLKFRYNRNLNICQFIHCKLTTPIFFLPSIFTVNGDSNLTQRRYLVSSTAGRLFRNS